MQGDGQAAAKQLEIQWPEAAYPSLNLPCRLQISEAESVEALGSSFFSILPNVNHAGGSKVVVASSGV